LPRSPGGATVRGMSCCSHCRDAEGFFGDRTARRELRRYRKRGPPTSTRRLLDALREKGVEGRTLLDVGGGVGMIQLELLDEGLRSALHIDASRPYLEVAEKALTEAGHGERTTRRFGDFVELVAQDPDVPAAEIVTLDRVICCYPRLAALLEASVHCTRERLGLVYPRERVGTRVVLAIGNLWFRIRRSDFRAYLHPPDQVHRILEAHGFRRTRSDRTFIWQVEVWEPADGPGGSTPD
jgi:hypothetical protein